MGEDMYQTFEELEAACKSCMKCDLCKNRTNVVIDTGNRNADIMLIRRRTRSK